jgi:hypothetical protein
MPEEPGDVPEPEEPLLPLSLRVGALALTLAGVGLIAAGGARGVTALTGFGLFCLGMAGFDGLYRGRLGFRQVALFLGPLALGIGLWAVVAAGLLGMLGLPVGPEVRRLVIAAGACAAASSMAALLAARAPGWALLRRVGEWIFAVGRRVWKPANRPDEPRHDRRFAAEPQSPPAGPVREG